MVRYLLKRLAWAAVVLWGITLVTFAIAFALPGDPAELMAGPQASPELVRSIRRELGLDDPLPAQYEA